MFCSQSVGTMHLWRQGDPRGDVGSDWTQELVDGAALDASQCCMVEFWQRPPSKKRDCWPCSAAMAFDFAEVQRQTSTRMMVVIGFGVCSGSDSSGWSASLPLLFWG